MKRGYHSERHQTSAVVSAVAVICCMTRAQAPAPRAASTTPQMAPPTEPASPSNSERRKSITRIISVSCVAPTAVTKKLADSATRSGFASGSPYSDAIGPARRMPSPVKSTPLPTVIQNAVFLSFSVSVLRWMSAAPRARSENTMTRLEKTMARAARPYSSGVSRRAMATATTARVT